MATTSPAVLSGPEGPARVLELESGRPADLLAAVRDGLPFTALEAVAGQLGLQAAEIGDLLGIPLRTFARRRKAQQLTPFESDRLYRIARTFALAFEVLGSPAKARLWPGSIKSHRPRPTVPLPAHARASAAAGAPRCG